MGLQVGRRAAGRGTVGVADWAALLMVAVSGLAPGMVAGATAQGGDDAGRYVQVIVTGVDLKSSVMETAAGPGVRAGYRVTSLVSIEAELAYCPENPAGNYGQTIGLAGPRLGGRWKRIGYGLVLKGGAIRFGGDFFRDYNGAPHTNVMVAAGLSVEYRWPSNVVLRADVADAIIPFGDTRIRGPLPPYVVSPGTTHNHQSTLAVGVYF